eukprot:1504432-Rhodomonas_salina.1
MEGACGHREAYTVISQLHSKLSYTARGGDTVTAGTEQLQFIDQRASPTVLHKRHYGEELAYQHAASPQLALPRQVLPVLHERPILILNAHPQASHELVVQVAFRRELLLRLEHGVEVACGGEDGVSEQGVELAGPHESWYCKQGAVRLIGVERPWVDQVDSIRKDEGDVLDSVALVVAGAHVLLVHHSMEVVHLASRASDGHEVPIQEAQDVVVTAALV